MKMVSAVTVFLAGAMTLLPFRINAQTIEQYLDAQIGTISVSVLPQFNSGKLVGCGIEFNAFARDWAYKKGGYVKISGSANMMAVTKGIGITLKVVLHDFDKSTLALTPAPPASAYLISANRRATSADMLVSAIPSDTPGALFSVFKADAFKMLAESVADDRITIAFARTRGGQDILVTIELDVIDTDNKGVRKRAPAQSSQEFFGCTKALLEAQRS